MRNRVLLVALTALLLPGIARATDWRAFKSDAGRFTVMLPDTPTEQTQEAEDGITRMFVAKSAPDHIFLVTYVELKEVAQEPAAAIFNQLRDGFLEGAMGELKAEQESEFEGRPAREFRALGQNGAQLQGRFIMDGKRVYAVIAVTPVDDPQPEESARFLESFSLAK